MPIEASNTHYSLVMMDKEEKYTKFINIQFTVTELTLIREVLIRHKNRQHGSLRDVFKSLVKRILEKEKLEKELECRLD